MTTVSTEQNQWQLFLFFTLDAQMFLNVIDTSSKEMELTSHEQAGHTGQVSKSPLPHCHV